jgi:predicted RNA-binding Zn-ribbon protein involved in translation (DUF1610 family)
MSDHCLACGQEIEEDADIHITRYLCDECFDVEREMTIESLGDEYRG